ncbi:MAG: glycine cleavage system aminomethyltransferase GcvT [Pseudomonadota bacterium]
MTADARTTALHSRHLAAGARTVDFGGWDMPVHYGSQVEEHHAVRGSAGMFDVSHMTVVDVSGVRVGEFLRYLLANDVAKLTARGKALYSCMLNERGGVIDDLIVYFLEPSFYRLVVNAATRDKDLAWIMQAAEPFAVTVTERDDLSMIAVQGPDARERMASTLTLAERERVLALKPFHAVQLNSVFVARTGYTGEDGFEVIVSHDDVGGLWDALLAAGVAPCGLGARDTLRLEAGMHLYGQDMDEDTLPLACGLAWTVSIDDDRDFIGRAALVAAREAGVDEKLVALLLEGRGVLRAGQTVMVGGQAVGRVTSGTFSPTMQRAIGLARVMKTIGGTCQVDIRGREVAASVHRPPFVRAGQIKIDV